MSELWQKNIRTCLEIIHQNLGPELVNVVSGSEKDREFWQDRLSRTRRDLFRRDGETRILSSLERTRKGNFLGSVNAWIELKRAMQRQAIPDTILMNMVFGLGKRLSPFTQALVNRKPAFPTPLKSASQDVYLNTADMAALSATLWLHHLQSGGFKGIVVKWGDEAVVPGRLWEANADTYREVDGIRFIWQTDPTEDLAREKEWVEFDQETREMTFQYTRQDLPGLLERLSHHGRNRRVGVNLGSLAISYPLMQAAEEVFQPDLADETKWVDWDPYTWIALSCQDEAEWRAEAELEQRRGKTGMLDLEKRIPDFFKKTLLWREAFRRRTGRSPLIRVLDFGEAYWMDWGLHLSMRRSLDALHSVSDQGNALRALFQLPDERDRRGNTIVRSRIPTEADICDSVLVDTLITDPSSVIHGGLVVAGRHRKLSMPTGGKALFCAGDDMQFNGPHAIAFYATGERFLLEEGDRLTCLYLAEGGLEMRSNESLVSYEGEAYSQPVLGNPLSFEEATRVMSLEDTHQVEKRWLDRWSGWIS